MGSVFACGPGFEQGDALLVEHIYTLGWRFDGGVTQDFRDPRAVGILLKAGAKGDHEIGKFADVAFVDDTVRSSALGTELDQLPGLLHLEGGKVFGEKFSDMHDHSVFEITKADIFESRILFFANGKHFGVLIDANLSRAVRG